MNPITAQIRAAYHASGLTTLQLALRAELAQRTVLRVLAGKPVHAESLLAVCCALEIKELRVTALSVTRRAS